MTPGRDNILKVVILGDSSVGKTSLMRQFVENCFSNSYKATIGVDFVTKEMTIDNCTIAMQIWDTAGQERYYAMTNSYYRGADGCVLVFDTTDPKTFASLDIWRDEFLLNTSPKEPEKFPFVLLGNKVDLENRKVTAKRAQLWCKTMNDIPYLETSAKEGLNVTRAFQMIARNAMANDSQDLSSPYTIFPDSLPLSMLDDQPDTDKKCSC